MFWLVVYSSLHQTCDSSTVLIFAQVHVQVWLCVEFFPWIVQSQSPPKKHRNQPITVHNYCCPIARWKSEVITVGWCVCFFGGGWVWTNHGQSFSQLMSDSHTFRDGESENSTLIPSYRMLGPKIEDLLVYRGKCYCWWLCMLITLIRRAFVSFVVLSLHGGVQRLWAPNRAFQRRHTASLSWAAPLQSPCWAGGQISLPELSLDIAFFREGKFQRAPPIFMVMCIDIHSSSLRIESVEVRRWR